jgi:FkbM family methyltransferase
LALSHVCAAQGRTDDARVFLTQILDIDPNHHAARQHLSQLLAAESDPKAHQLSRQKDAAYPSDLIEQVIEASGKTFSIKIPANETFRIESIFGQQEEYAVDPIINSWDNGPVVVDVGANIGLFAIYCKAKFPHSRIHCFEPCPQTQRLLKDNINGLSGIELHSYGLYHSDMHTLLNLHQHNTGENSIKRSDRAYTDAIEIQLKDAGKQIDALGLTHIHILKIDTEGCEVEILESLGARLDKVDCLLMEYHNEKDRRRIDRLLENFSVFGAKATRFGVGTVKYVHNRLL